MLTLIGTMHALLSLVTNVATVFRAILAMMLVACALISLLTALRAIRHIGAASWQRENKYAGPARQYLSLSECIIISCSQREQCMKPVRFC